MTSSNRWIAVGATCLVLTPLVTAAADLARMWAESSGATTGIIDTDADAQVSSLLTAIAAEPGIYQLASWLALAAAVLAVPAVATVRGLTIDRTPRWSLAALLIGGCLVVGEFVHLMGYFAWNQILAGLPDHQAAVAVTTATGHNTFGLVVFAPYLIGMLLFWPVAGIALYRAGQLGRWALALVLLAGLAMAVLGSSYVVSPAWAGATTAGLLPVLVARLRSSRTSATIPASAATEASTSASVVR